MRHLRHYERVAHLSHFCDNCMKYIMPGEMYSGDVWVGERIGLFVQKQHVHPYCDFPDFEKEFGLESLISKPSGILKKMKHESSKIAAKIRA